MAYEEPCIQSFGPVNSTLKGKREKNREMPQFHVLIAHGEHGTRTAVPYHCASWLILFLEALSKRDTTPAMRWRWRPTPIEWDRHFPFRTGSVIKLSGVNATGPVSFATRAVSRRIPVDGSQVWEDWRQKYQTMHTEWQISHPPVIVQNEGYF